MATNNKKRKMKTTIYQLHFPDGRSIVFGFNKSDYLILKLGDYINFDISVKWVFRYMKMSLEEYTRRYFHEKKRKERG